MDLHLSWPARFVIAGRSLWFYAWKVVFPARLMAVYPRWDPGAGPWLAVFPLGALVAVILVWCFRERIGRGPATAVLFFVVSLTPVLGFVDFAFMEYTFVADRFQYLASLGLIILFTSGLLLALDRFGEKRITIRSVGTLVVLLILGLLTWKQSETYRNMGTLFRHNLAGNPDCWVAHNNLGAALGQKGDAVGALRHLAEALRLKADYADAHANLARLYEGLGETAKAMEHYREAVSYNPQSLVSLFNLGNIYFDLGRYPQAAETFERYLQIAPRYSRRDYARLYLFLSMARTAGPTAARGILSGAEAESEWCRDLYRFHLGELSPSELISCASQGDPESLPGRLCEAYYNTGMMYALKGDDEPAIHAFQACLATGQTGFHQYDRARVELSRLTEK